MVSFRLDTPTMESVSMGIRRTYFGNMAAFVETMLMQYASAYDYAKESMPIWNTALTSAPDGIKRAAETYPPFLHYQFSGMKSHTEQEQGYFIRIRHFSSDTTAIAEVYSPEPKVISVQLADLTPIYCCRDIVNELNR
jgi:hypothetical protein